MNQPIGSRRGRLFHAIDDPGRFRPAPRQRAALEAFDALYRALCAILYNYAPGSGHPGGSISSGRIAQALVFHSLDYDLSQPDRPDSDILSYAAGHKALGLYALYALRNETARAGRSALLPRSPADRFRLEDLLGFRRNPIHGAPLFRRWNARPLDGHPTPAAPFVRLSTGASGVGVGSSFGLALGALDAYPDAPPRIHVIEGEGGMTPGRVAEAFSAAATMGLRNLVVHVDWNQASIDSDRVCGEKGEAGEYVPWDPAEFALFHDWNVIRVPDGHDFDQILAAQRNALSIDNGQPTAVVYRTRKGWGYGVEGRASHGAGHALCADGFFAAIDPLLGGAGGELPRCCGDRKRCLGRDPARIEECFWKALRVVRNRLAADGGTVRELCGGLESARDRLRRRRRRPRASLPDLKPLFRLGAARPPKPLALKPGAETTLRAELGNALDHLNRLSGGGLFVASADLLASTSVSLGGRSFERGFWHASRNPGSRTLATGGICEDAMAAILSGLSAFGFHIGVGSSYAAFLAPLGHMAARLHAIGGQALRARRPDEPDRPMILVCAHAGLKTGEDGPTHADPQPLQVLQDGFPPGSMITLTPWEPSEIWPLLATALRLRPAVIAPFVTRPNERVPDRAGLGLAPAREAVTGMYPLRKADPARRRDGTIVLQESAVAYAFVETALPRLDRDGANLNVFYVASAELFDRLTPAARRRIYPEALAREAMGITGFTRPTLDRWILSERGRAASLHPFRKGHFCGSGPGAVVLREAGLDGMSQYRAIRRFLRGG